MPDKPPDGSATASPVPTDDRLNAPANGVPTTEPAPMVGPPPSSAGLRSVFAQWVVSRKRQTPAAQAPNVPRPTPPGAAPAPAPAPVVPDSVALVPAVAAPDAERTQLYQRVPEHLLRRARARQSEDPGANTSEHDSQPAEEDRTAVFAPPSELLLLARRRAGSVRPAAGNRLPGPTSVDSLLDEVARSDEASRFLAEAARFLDEAPPAAVDSLSDEEARVSTRIATLSGAHAPGDDVTHVASFRKLMGLAPPSAPPAPVPDRSPWYRSVGWTFAGLAAAAALTALYWWWR